MAQRRNKYDALLATAARLFKQQGFACTSLDQVAAQLGITKPTLYYYVRSKDELVHACAIAGLERAQVSVERALAAAPEADALAAALKAYAHAVASDFGWCMVRATEYAQPAHCQKQASQLRAALEQCLTAAAACVAMPVPVMLRALEGVVLALPRTQWASLIDRLATPALGMASVAAVAVQAPVAAVEAATLPVPEPVAVQAVEPAIKPRQASEALLPAMEKPQAEHQVETKKSLEYPVLERSQSVVKKATKRSVVAKIAPAIEQISLF